MGSEIDPSPLMGRLLEAGARLALPAASLETAPMVFRAFDFGDPLELDAFGALAPLGGASEVQPDLVIAPLLAFDRFGGRIGQGGGHYDRTLAALRARGPVFVLGLAYAGQEVGTLPRDPHDEPLDAVVTELGLRHFFQAAS